MTERVIRGPDCLTEGAAWLVTQEPRFAPALTLPLPLRLQPQGFDALLSAIISQQVSVASAKAILARMDAAGMTRPEAILAADEQTLRALGLSRQKARYAVALAGAGIDFDTLAAMPSAAVVARLMQVPGIGAWTAEIYAMFALGRADVFAPGDLALQEAARALFSLTDRPREGILRRMALDWSPWRAVAARALWSYYRSLKGREGAG